MGTVADTGTGTGAGGGPAVRRVALLRGINVGRGARIAMADLAACTEAVGCADVRTVLATGNVLLTDARPEPELRDALEAAYAERFGYDAVVQVLALDALDDAVAAYPFESLADHHDYLVFSDDPSVTGRVAEAMAAAVDPAVGPATSAREPVTGGDTEAVAAGPGCVYWRVAKGSTLSSAAGKVLDARANKRHLTTRNVRTLRKVLAAG